MVHASAAFSAESEVQRRDSEVIHEGRVVGAGAESLEAQVAPLPRVFAVFGRAPLVDPPHPQALADGDLLLRVLDLGRGGVYHRFEGMRSVGAQEPAPARVAVDVRHGLALELLA